MKAIFIATVGELLCLFVATIVLRQSHNPQRALLLLIVFLLVMPFLAVAHYILPSDLWILPVSMIAPYGWLDLCFSLFLYTAGFFGGVLQLYNLADRGFSLRILIDILEHTKATMTLDEVMSGYSAGRGIQWMYAKRIDGMVETGLITPQKQNKYTHTAKGQRVARFFDWMRNFIKLPPMSTASK